MTLMEIVFAITAFSLFGVGSILAITQFNRLSSLNRYHTLALSVAEQKIDQVLATPWTVSGVRPPILAIGTTTETSLPLNNDIYNSSRTGLGSPYSGLDTQILNSRVTTVTALTDASGNTGAASRLLQVSVTVNYTYCLKFATTTTLTVLRTTDDF